MKAIIIGYDRQISRFMQDADMFEKGKVALCPVLKATVEPEFCMSNIEAIKKVYNETQPYGLVAVFVPNHPEPRYVNPDVKMVSDGQYFYSVDQFIKMHE